MVPTAQIFKQKKPNLPQPFRLACWPVKSFFQSHFIFWCQRQQEPLPCQKAPVIARKIVKMAIERAVCIDTIVISYSRIKVRMFFAKDESLSRIFSKFCFILATCVFKIFLFCDSVSSLAYCSVFKNKWNHLQSFAITFSCVYQFSLILRYLLPV